MASALIRPFAPDDAAAGFRCGKHALDDFFARHAATNERIGIGRTYVCPRGPDEPATVPAVLGFYTLSMADVEPKAVAGALGESLPRYALPVALIGRLAVDLRVRGRRVGEALLVDALRRVLEASAVVGCVASSSMRRTPTPKPSTPATTSRRLRPSGHVGCSSQSPSSVKRSPRDPSAGHWRDTSRQLLTKQHESLSD